MPTPEGIQLRDDLIKVLELLNYILASPAGTNHPHYQELKTKYHELKAKIERSDHGNNGSA